MTLLIHFYDAFQSDYDPEFKCVDEMVNICDTENDDYTREGLRSFIIGCVQRAAIFQVVNFRE